ncbi:putative beta-D-xylosidase 6-like [Dorcoceras hygrometricum]|uniref:Putative beta-D-xylosidase 6-like n=1 Tax=Dorcoceras hygrometricum TaxID=472368 RepID=A0A2Z7B247_9LAMI|nr:putative beta-D-xylosidase 6-like [Dorcoceras hygrometricum]
MILLFLQLISSTDSKIQYPCQPPQHNSYPFCNASLSTNSRAQFLVSLLTLDEKIQQLSDNASAVPRLGIPPYEWWSESLHGIAVNGPGVSFDGVIKCATGFPQVILTAASFNRSLWSAVAAAIAVEAKAMFNYGQAGLTYWAPNINIFRDPRWGRGQETPGEDPMVTSAFAVEYVRAFQGQYYAAAERRDQFRLGQPRKALTEEEDVDKLMLSACCKHFIAYDLENWGQFTRYNFNAVVTDQDMADTYQPPFKSCIQQGASCLMCSYNGVNGIPACADSGLLQKVRKEWNFKGYITSDCDAVATIYEYQNYAKTPEDAVAMALKAGLNYEYLTGTDINCGTYMSRNMKSVIREGKVLEKDIDRALLNLFSVQLRLGLFDGELVKNRFRGFGPRDVCSSDHKKLALEAATQGIVLLKNDLKILPLDKPVISSLAVVGPLANSTELGGGYTGIPCNPKSILGGLQEHVTNVYYATGCVDVACYSTDKFSEALSVAKQAEHVVVVAGLDLSQEKEDHDRYSLLLPGYQMKLVNAVASVSKRPLILVLTGGGPLDVSFAVGDPHVGSILWIGYPGETGGKALSEIIFGHYSPGGKLPMTWYPESFTRVPMTDMNMRADPSRNYPGRTHRFYNGDTVYPFGYGLSYTSFTYKLLSAPSKLSLEGFLQARPQKNILYQTSNGLDYVHVDELTYCESLRFEVQISVTNKGDIDASEVVLLFAKGLELFEGSPERQLIGFDRLGLLAHTSAEASFMVDPCEHLGFADKHGNRILPLGDHIIISQDLEHVVSIGL